MFGGGVKRFRFVCAMKAGVPIVDFVGAGTWRYVVFALLRANNNLVAILIGRYYRALLLDYASDDDNSLGGTDVGPPVGSQASAKTLAISLGKSPTDVIVQTTAFFGAT